MEVDLQGLITGLLGAISGGLGVSWIAKAFFSNYIEANDEKHKETRFDFKQILKQLNDLDKNLAVTNTKLDSFVDLQPSVIILKQQMGKITKDINAAHTRLKEIG